MKAAKLWFRRLLVAGLVCAIGLPLVGFGLSNLYLASLKGRDFVGSKIRAVTGLDVSVMGSSWSPWNGISVYGMNVEQPGQLKMELPSPFVRIERIRAAPSWRNLVLNRRLLLKGIELYKPELVLPVELLSQLPSQPPVVVQPPAVVQQVIPVPKQTPTEQTSPAPLPSTVSHPKTVAGTPEAKARTAIENVREISSPTVWLKFFGGSVKIVSVKADKTLYQISDLEGNVPLAGKRATSKILLNRIKFLGDPIAETMTIPLEWHSPMLQLGAFDMEIFGIRCEAVANIAITEKLPFQIQAILPKQENQEIGLSEKTNGKLGSIVGQGVFKGQLTSPATWQGQWITQAASIETNFAGNTAHFDQGRAIMVFQNGTLRCLEARLIGESLSVIGNATFLSNGRAAANGRIIAAPDTLVAISKFTQPHSSAPVLTPLSTPQRAALDLQVFGKLGEFYFQPNPRATPIPLN